MVTRPKVLILDEPTAALPPKMAHLILEKVATEVRPRGVPVLMIEQRVTDALAIADRAYVMANGRVACEGLASEFTQQALADVFLSG